MTDEEKQEIIEAVMEEINGNTRAVEDMPLAEDLDALVPGIDGETTYYTARLINRED